MPAVKFLPASRRSISAALLHTLSTLVRICTLASALTVPTHASPSAPDRTGFALTTPDQAYPHSDPLRIAVAANFRFPLAELADKFEQRHGTPLAVTYGSSGLLAAQIRQGAPFDAYFSADTKRPRALIGDGLAIAPVTVYARGQVALKTSGAPANTRMDRIGIPNPQLAPYGAAAVKCLQRLGMWGQLQGRLVFGNNVNQVDHFLESGALKAGFVALSQLVARGTSADSYWVCPGAFHAPIDQGAVVLQRSPYRRTAAALLRFMTSPGTQVRLAQMGYVQRD